MTEKNENKSTRYGFTWWLKNLLVVAVVFFVCPKLVKTNMAYQWLIDNYVKGNSAVITQMRDLTLDQRLEAKLGYDYVFLELIRNRTPQDAVVFYPSREDFIDTSVQQQIAFSGNLCDKLSAVRFLYPRHIVIEPELGKTSWSKRITHVAIVNGHGRELLKYPTDSTVVINVLPIDTINPSKRQ